MFVYLCHFIILILFFKVIYDFLQASGLANGQTPIIPILMEVMCGFFSESFKFVFSLSFVIVFYTDVGDKCKTFQSIITSIFWTEAELASNDFATIATGLTDVIFCFEFFINFNSFRISNSCSGCFYSKFLPCNWL